MSSRIRVATFVTLLALPVGCRTPEPTVTHESPPPRNDGGAAPSEPRQEVGYPMPASILARVHLPGPDAERQLSIAIRQEEGSWFMSGCITAIGGPCTETSRIALGDEDTLFIRTQLSLVFTTPVSCAQPEPGPDDREYRITIDGHDQLGYLPADPAAIPERTTDSVCNAMSRLAWWMAQRFQA